MRRIPSLALSIVLVVPLLLAGCAGFGRSGERTGASPTPASYLVGADGARKAPHEVAFHGTAARLQLTNLSVAIDARRATVLNSLAPPGRNATLTLANASGVVREAGVPFAFSGATLTLSAARPWPLVGRLHATLLATVLVESARTTVYFALPGPLASAVHPSPRLGTFSLPDGLDVNGTTVTFARGLPAGFRNGGASELFLSPGDVGFTGAPVRFENASGRSGFDVGKAGGREAIAAVGVADSRENLTVAQTNLSIVGDELALSRASGAVDVSTRSLDLVGEAVQVIAKGLPLFEANLAASAASATVPRGGHGGTWVTARETSGVGSAVSLHLAVVDAPGFAFEPSDGWVARESNDTLAALAAKPARLGDFGPHDLSPGATREFALDVRAPADAAPGAHLLRLALVAGNARVEFDVPVTVT